MPATKGQSGETPEKGAAASRPLKVDTAVPPKARAKEEAREREERRRAARESGYPEPSPRWWAPVMSALMILGLVWIVVFYVSQGSLPVRALGNWNILVGFAFMLVGFAMTTRWR